MWDRNGTSHSVGTLPGHLSIGMPALMQVSVVLVGYGGFVYQMGPDGRPPGHQCGTETVPDVQSGLSGHRSIGMPVLMQVR